MIKRCVICGIEFAGHKARVTCGSTECRNDRRREKQRERCRIPPVIKNCIICGRFFRVLPATMKTCGTKCSTQLVRRRVRKHHKIVKNCIVCGRFFRARGNTKICGQPGCLAGLRRRRNQKSVAAWVNTKEQARNHMQQPKVKERRRIYQRNYRQRPAVKERKRKREAQPEAKERRQNYDRKDHHERRRVNLGVLTARILEGGSKRPETCSAKEGGR